MASIGTAHASEQVLWQKFGEDWSVYAYPDSRLCLAMGYYTNGRTASMPQAASNSGPLLLGDGPVLEQKPRHSPSRYVGSGNHLVDGGGARWA
jgi:hypothetical protein